MAFCPGERGLYVLQARCTDVWLLGQAARQEWHSEARDLPRITSMLDIDPEKTAVHSQDCFTTRVKRLAKVFPRPLYTTFHVHSYEHGTANTFDEVAEGKPTPPVPPRQRSIPLSLGSPRWRTEPPKPAHTATATVTTARIPSETRLSEPGEPDGSPEFEKVANGTAWPQTGVKSQVSAMLQGFAEDCQYRYAEERILDSVTITEKEEECGIDEGDCRDVGYRWRRRPDRMRATGCLDCKEQLGELGHIAGVVCTCSTIERDRWSAICAIPKRAPRACATAELDAACELQYRTPVRRSCPSC